MSAVQVCADKDRECGDFERGWCASCPKRRAMSADLPKPAVAVYPGELSSDIACRCQAEPLFTESQLREFAEAKCAELRAAADGMMKKADELIRRCAVGELMPEDIEELVSSIAAYRSAREPRQ